MTHPLEQMHIKTTVSLLHVDALLTYLDSQGLREQGQSPTTKKKKDTCRYIRTKYFWCCIYFFKNDI